MTTLKKTVTLKTLAKILDLTPATISKALHDSPDISEKTRRLVKEKAEELGYEPNIMAQTLVRRRSHLLGVIVPDLGHSFFAQVTKSIFEEARHHGYEAIIMLHDENPKIERRDLGFLSALNVDGILIASVPGTKNKELIKRIHDRGVPILCFDRIVDELEFSSITIDDEKASFELSEFMINSGCRNIVFLGPTKDLFVAKGRYKGYCKALAHYNIIYRPEYVIECNINSEDAYIKMKQAIVSGLKFDALLCLSGIIAYGAGQAIIDEKLSIPEDVLLGEFGDNDIVHRLGVPFITVDQFPYQMGKKAVAMLIDIIKSKDKHLPIEHIFIDTKIVYHHRDSCV